MAKDFDLYERELWAGRGPAYERGFARLTRYLAGPLLDAAGVTGGTRFLDVGTGPGFVALEATPSCRTCRSPTGRSTRSPATASSTT